MIPFRFLLLSFLLLSPLLASGATGTFRPYTGEGVLAVTMFVPERRSEVATTIPLYRTPGVGRVREVAPGDLPGLSQVMASPAGVTHVAVLAQKGNWLKIAYDEAGQEGWLEKRRYWSYSSWEEYLKGGVAHLLPRLQKVLYALRQDSDARSREISPLTPQRKLTIIDLKGDWALVLVDLTLTGWVRWRDEDGRFLISLDDAVSP